MKTNKVLTIGMIALMAVAARGGNPELPLDLNSAGDFVILAKTGISTVPSSDITGDMGVSPITATAITGFSLMLDTPSAGQFSTSAQVDGKIYAADYAVPTPTKMTAAISDMESAFTAAALRPLPGISLPAEPGKPPVPDPSLPGQGRYPPAAAAGTLGRGRLHRAAHAVREPGDSGPAGRKQRDRCDPG